MSALSVLGFECITSSEDGFVYLIIAVIFGRKR
jgi:hypothetical protein